MQGRGSIHNWALSCTFGARVRPMRPETRRTVAWIGGTSGEHDPKHVLGNLSTRDGRSFR